MHPVEGNAQPSAPARLLVSNGHPRHRCRGHRCQHHPAAAAAAAAGVASTQWRRTKHHTRC
eukprot:4742292-Alexandrium_andersonii.AAC.1